MKHMKRIRDELDNRTLRLATKIERVIESSGEFKRMKFVKTLGLSFLVYPGANSTRYNHSLGSAYLAKRLGEELGLKESDIQLLTSVMLSHDLGHWPFSHATEEGVEGIDHEELTRQLITGEIKMPRPYCGRLAKAIYEAGVDPAEMSALLLGKHESKLLNSAVSGYFDLDKADYLRRDSNLTALIGTIDLERLFDVLVADNGELCVLEKGIDSFVHFVNARKNMYRNVYNHPDTAIYERMIRHAINAAGLNGNGIWFMTDDELLAALHSKGGHSQRVVDEFYAGREYSIVYSISSRDHGNIAAAEKLKSIQGLEDEIANHSGMKREDIVTAYKIPKKERKTPEFPVILGNGTKCNIFDYDPRAANAEIVPRTMFYAEIAVPKETSPGQKQKANDAAQSILKSA